MLNLHRENIWWTQTEIHPTGYQTSTPHDYEAIKYWETLRQLLETSWSLEDTATCNGMLWLGPWNRERMSGKKTHWNLMGFFQWTWLRVRPILVYKQQTYRRKTKMQWWEKETRTETRKPSAPSLHSLKLLKVFKFNFVTMGLDSIQTDHILLPY